MSLTCLNRIKLVYEPYTQILPRQARDVSKQKNRYKEHTVPIYMLCQWDLTWLSVILRAAQQYNDNKNYWLDQIAKAPGLGAKVSLYWPEIDQRPRNFDEAFSQSQRFSVYIFCQSKFHPFPYIDEWTVLLKLNQEASLEVERQFLVIYKWLVGFYKLCVAPYQLQFV